MSLCEFEFPITLGISEKCLPLLGRGLKSAYRQKQGPEPRFDVFPSPDVQPGTVGDQKNLHVILVFLPAYLFALSRPPIRPGGRLVCHIE
jgi:hypothetical protein